LHIRKISTCCLKSCRGPAHADRFAAANVRLVIHDFCRVADGRGRADLESAEIARFDEHLIDGSRAVWAADEVPASNTVQSLAPLAAPSGVTLIEALLPVTHAALIKI
jgi:hypothetical protein